MDLKNGFENLRQWRNVKGKLCIFSIRIRIHYFSIFSVKDEITEDRLSEADLVIFGGPRELFSVAEFKELKSWLNNGGRALILLGDGGEKQTGCNLNYLLEE
jgi:intraflagellar transport protein 52